MIELVPGDYDDVGFLSLAQRIMNGAIKELRMCEVFLVHIDNWFDHKWLGWRSRRRSRRGREELRVPTFTPNRVRSEKHFVWEAETSTWEISEMQGPIHIRQPGRPSLAQPLDRFSECAAFIWYSGNTAINKVGCLMLYLSGAEGYAWYASFRKGNVWTIDEECRVTRRELLAFEGRGRQLELPHT